MFARYFEDVWCGDMSGYRATELPYVESANTHPVLGGTLGLGLFRQELGPGRS